MRTVVDVSSGNSTQEPDAPVTLTLAEAKAIKIAGLQAAYEAAMQAGFTSSALGTPHFYLTNDHRIALLAGAVSSGSQRNYFCQDLGTGQWAQTPHTAAQMRQVVDDGAVVAEGYIARLTSRIAQVQDPLTDTQAKVDAINW